MRGLLKKLAAGGLASEDHDALVGWIHLSFHLVINSHLQCEALRARIADTNATVIETLYSDPRTILPIMSNASFIESVSKALAAPDVPRAVMRLHFAFIAEEFSGHNMDLAPVIFERLYLPYILFTKPRQKTATLVWQSLKDSELADYELLTGCMDIVFVSLTADGTSRSVEELATLNIEVTTKIAG